MFDPKILLIATNNQGKVGEIKALLADLVGIELVTPKSVGLQLDPPEDGATYLENASAKAQAFALASGLPALADDSGLEVEALGGAPGVHSARYAPQPGATDADRRAYLLQQVAGRPRPWRASFRSTICLALPGGAVFSASGACPGQVIPEERGQGGFGYDRIFLIEGQSRTMAELSAEEKNRLSHRARALEAMKPILRRELGLPASL